TRRRRTRRPARGGSPPRRGTGLSRGCGRREAVPCDGRNTSHRLRARQDGVIRLVSGRAGWYTGRDVIRSRGLAKRSGEVEAVRGLDLEIPTGQLLALLGPNGAGKSTTVKMLTGMLPPTGGTAEVFGFDVVRQPVEVKKIVGYVPESGAVFETLTG